MHRHALTPSQAADIARRARKLRRRGELTAHALVVLDALLWTGRAPGADRATAAYARIQKLARVCRATAVGAIKQLVRLGLIRKHKQRDLVLWNNGGRKWRQRPNIYEFCCQSVGQSEYQEQKINIIRIEPDVAEVRRAQDALAAIAARRQGMLMKVGGG